MTSSSHPIRQSSNIQIVLCRMLRGGRRRKLQSLSMTFTAATAKRRMWHPMCSRELKRRCAIFGRMESSPMTFAESILPQRRPCLRSFSEQPPNKREAFMKAFQQRGKFSNINVPRVAKPRNFVPAPQQFQRPRPPGPPPKKDYSSSSSSSSAPAPSAKSFARVTASRKCRDSPLLIVLRLCGSLCLETTLHTNWSTGRRVR